MTNTLETVSIDMTNDWLISNKLSIESLMPKTLVQRFETTARKLPKKDT